MIKIRRKWLFILITLPVIAYFSYTNWHEGTPYEEKQYSPNKEFYYQLYKVFSIDEWIPYASSPGGFSNGENGYVRAYTAAGDFMGETYAHGMPMAHVFWARNKLIVMDGEESGKDGEGIIILPGSSSEP